MPGYIDCHGESSQNPLEHNHSPKLLPDWILRIQQILGIIMYYAWAVNLTMIITLGSIASEQVQATEQMEKYINELLDYLHTHIHSDES